MGAAWRGMRDGTEKFERALGIGREVSQLDMEVCVTLGEIGPVEACKLKAAGATAYSQNINTSQEFLSEDCKHAHISRSREHNCGRATSGVSVCCGGIIGMGESIDDRLRMMEIVSELDPQPQSVPINCLMPQRGTPLEDRGDLISLASDTDTVQFME